MKSQSSCHSGMPRNTSRQNGKSFYNHSSSSHKHKKHHKYTPASAPGLINSRIIYAAQENVHRSIPKSCDFSHNINLTSPSPPASTLHQQISLVSPHNTRSSSQISSDSPHRTSRRGFASRHQKVPNRPNQTKLSLKKQVETALQLGSFNAPTSNKSMALNKITHLERQTQTKLDWLSEHLQTPSKYLTLFQIQEIYHTFLDVRFASSIEIWQKIMKLWSDVASFPHVDESIKTQANSIVMSLMDELINIEHMGTYNIMKNKKYLLPEHLIKFNLRPTNTIYSQVMKTMLAVGNYQGVLDIYKRYSNELSNLPNIQYLPPPILPQGPEREQELVSRRLIASRREELLHTSISDQYVMKAAYKAGEHQLADKLMNEITTQRGYETSTATHALYLRSLLSRGQYIAAIEIFKRSFQPPEVVIEYESIDKKQKKDVEHKKIESTRNVDETKESVQQRTLDDLKSRNVLISESNTDNEGEKFSITSIGKFDPTIPSFVFDSNLIHPTFSPSRQTWLQIFKAIAAMHPFSNESEQLNNKPHNNSTKSTALATVDTNSDNSLREFIFNNENVFDQDAKLRKHVYAIAKEKYGLTIDKSFFLPMVKEAPTFESAIAYMNDFHEELDALRVKSNQNPWTSEEIEEQNEEENTKRMLIVDLNVQGHDRHFNAIFGRYRDEAKKLGYDEEFYASLQKRFLETLVDTTTNDNVESLYTAPKYDEDGNRIESNDDEINQSDSSDESYYDQSNKQQSVSKIDTLHAKYSKSRQNKIQNSEVDTLLNDDTDEADDTADIYKNANKSESNTLQHYHQLYDVNGRPSIALYTSPTLKQIAQLNKSVTETLLSSTTRHKVRNVLAAIQTTRNYQDAYGLTISSEVESSYLRSLIFTARRNEEYPPLMNTNNTTLVRYDVAAYTPTAGKQSNGPKPHPIVNFRDRIQYINQSLLRRESLLQLCYDEILQVIDSLSTMKNEKDQNLELKQINLKVLSDFIEAYSELSVDASLLRGPFSSNNVFRYNAVQANEVMTALADGINVPGMKIDGQGNKYVPGITEPAPHQVDHVDIQAFGNISNRIAVTAHASIKRALSTLLEYADGMTLHQVQHIPLLSGDLSMYTERTYLPLLNALSAHGDYTNVLLLIESAHQHHGVIPTTKMLNHAAIAFINSDKPRHAAGVLDIMLKASNSENRHHKPLSEHDLERAVIHGNAHELLDKLDKKLSQKVFPNSETLSLLLNMYKEQGMLDHVEELWRRMIKHDDSTWTSFSAVEEQQLVQHILTGELEGSFGRSSRFDSIRGTVPGTVALDISLLIEDAYDAALNPIKNQSLKQTLRHNQIKHSMKNLLRNRRLPSVLPEGAHRTDIPESYKAKLTIDSTTSTVLMQSFIQLGHPMHALQIYLDMRQNMPVFPNEDLPLSPQYIAAIENNKRHHRMYPSIDDPLTSVLHASQNYDIRMDAEQEIERSSIPLIPTKQMHNIDEIMNGNISLHKDGTIIKHHHLNLQALTPRGLSKGESLDKPVKQLVHVSSRALINVKNTDQSYSNGLIPETTKQSMSKYIWPEVDAIASLALYALRKGQQFILSEEENLQNLPEELFAHAHILEDVSLKIIEQLKDYAISHPYLPGDESSTLFYSHPKTKQNVVSEHSGLHLAQPRLLLPLVHSTESLYALIDSLVYSDIALEETAFKIRYKKLAPIGMKRWFTIFPTMINQCKSIYNLKAERDDIIEQVDNLRDDVQELIATGPTTPKALPSMREQYKNTNTAAQPTFDLSTNLYNKSGGVFDRGLAHPSTERMTNAILPGAKLPNDESIKFAVKNKKANILNSFQEFLTQNDAFAKFQNIKQSKTNTKVAQETHVDIKGEIINGNNSQSNVSTAASTNKIVKRDILKELQNQIVSEQQAATSISPIPSPGSFSNVEASLSNKQDDYEDISNHLTLPEVSNMKKHLYKQSKLQKHVLEEFRILRHKEQTEQEKLSVSHISSGVHLLHDLHSLHPSLTHTFDTDTLSERHGLSNTEWLVPTTDLNVARGIAKRAEQVSARRKNTPGNVHDEQHKQSASQMLKSIQRDETESKTIPKRRPGGVLTSPFGPDSKLPPEQFRAPSTMARLANTPDTQIDHSQLALSTERKPFKLATHGVSMSDRPGIPTRISQEYLEKYVMGLSPDNKDKYNQRRHAALEEKFENVMVDPSFIKSGSANAAPITASDIKNNGYGEGYHQFKGRTHEKSQQVAFEQRQALLNEFTDEVLQTQKDRQQMTKDERAKNMYSDLFEIGDNANIHHTGAYNMLTKEDQQRRDISIKNAAFDDLDAIFKKPEPLQNANLEDLAKTLDFDVRRNKKKASEKTHFKEVQSSAVSKQPQQSRKNGAISDPFGVKSRNKSDPNRSTLFD